MKPGTCLATGFPLRVLRPKGFTLVEVVVIVLVVAILAGIAVVSYQRIIGDAEDSEAVVQLGAIRQAEFAERAQAGTFVNASTTEDVGVKLDILELQDKIFRYKVVNATLDDFLALAERIMEDPTGKKSAMIALSADGTLSKSTAYYGMGYGGQGGAAGGGGGGGASLGGGSGSGAGGGGGGGDGGGDGGGGSGDSGSGDGEEGSPEPSSSSAQAEWGTPQATGNDGFIQLGWDFSSGFPATSFRISRATSQEGPFKLFVDGWPVWYTNFVDFVANDQLYFYKIEAVADDGTFIVCPSTLWAMASATSTYAVAVQAAFEMLDVSVAGAQIADRVDLYGASIGFGSGVEGAAAWYEPFFNTITINISEFSSSVNVHAALLGHEGTHAWWYHDTTQGQPLRAGDPDDPDRLDDNSIDQEYHAFTNGANVWDEVKDPAETDFNQDSWAAVMALGEAQAKEVIRLYYPGLQEY